MEYHREAKYWDGSVVTEPEEEHANLLFTALLPCNRLILLQRVILQLLPGEILRQSLVDFGGADI